MANNADNHELLVEVVGLLANLTKLDLPANMTWLKILKEQNILNLISKLLVPGMCQNDLLLEVVLLVSTAVSEAPVCEILATSNVIGLLFQLWQVLECIFKYNTMLSKLYLIYIQTTSVLSLSFSLCFSLSLSLRKRQKMSQKLLCS